jgi:hypothetical protein
MGTFLESLSAWKQRRKTAGTAMTRRNKSCANKGHTLFVQEGPPVNLWTIFKKKKKKTTRKQIHKLLLKARLLSSKENKRGTPGWDGAVNSAASRKELQKNGCVRYR